MSAAPQPTHVYVLGFSDHVIKVGRTSNFDNRLAKHVQDAKIRRAQLTSAWSHEVDNARESEFWLIRCGHSHLESLVGEYFAGDYDTFLPEAIRYLQRRHLLPAAHETFEQVCQRFGFTERQLLAARLWDALPGQWHKAEDGHGYFLSEDIDEWATAEMVSGVKEYRR